MQNTTKVDRRIIKSREVIKKAFLELFIEKNFAQITINDISERANVNRGTIYLHYHDIYDLLDSCIEEHVNELIAFCTPHELVRDKADFIAELESVFIYLSDNFPFFSSLFSSNRTFAFRERLLNFITDNIKDKLKSKNTETASDLHIKAHFIAYAYIGIVEWWIQRGMPHPPKYMAEQLSLLFEGNDI